MDKQNAESAATRIEAMKALQEERWSDPYELSKKLRTSFRADKKERKVRDEGDDVVRKSYGLPSDLLLEDVTVEQQDEARLLWQAQQARTDRERLSGKAQAQKDGSGTRITFWQSNTLAQEGQS